MQHAVETGAAAGGGAIILRQARPRPRGSEADSFFCRRPVRLFCSQMISVEPPPISNTSAPLVFAGRSGARSPAAARSASSSGRDHFQVDARLVAGAARPGCRHCRPGAPPGWRWRAHARRHAWRCARHRFSARRWCGRSRRRTEARFGSPPRPAARCGRRNPPPGNRRRRGRGGDQQAAIVGAKVQHRQKRPGPAFLHTGILAVSVHFSPGGTEHAAAWRSLTRAKARGGMGNRRKPDIPKGLACKGLAAGLKGRSRRAPHVPDGGSSNGRTPDSDSGCLGSNPSPPANCYPELRQSFPWGWQTQEIPEYLSRAVPRYPKCLTVFLTVSGDWTRNRYRQMPLTALGVKNAKPKAKPYKISDEKGLYLVVTPGGSKLWRFDYRYGEKRKTLALGKWDDVELAQARERRDVGTQETGRGWRPQRDGRARNSSGQK